MSARRASVKVDQFVVNVNSEQPEKLIGFYRDVVSLTPNPYFGPVCPDLV